MQLSGKTALFDALGVRIVVMSYDGAADNLRFTRQHELPFPILTDEDSRHFHRFGIFNDGFEPGHRFYGIPHPGIVLVDREGKIFAKFAEENYRDRPELDHVIEAAEQMIRSR